MKDLYLLGSTGSIGTQTLAIVQNNPGKFRVRTLACANRIYVIREQIKAFHPAYVSVKEPSDADQLKREFPWLEVGSGEAGLRLAATYDSQSADGLMVNALVGIAGLEPTIASLEIGRDVALANKESLVVGGALIKQIQERTKAKLLPIDSEHSGIWQCLRGEDPATIRRVYITASGGAFRDKSRADLKTVTLADCLKHPNWQMGKKITVDSATMMNKAFELIEAATLYDLPIDTINPILHPESIVHALVEFTDGSLKAQLAMPDMLLPISYALFYPERLPTNVPLLDVEGLKQLHFEALDRKRFPLLDVALAAYRQGGTALCVLNGANEAAVQLFLEERIDFLDIETIITQALKQWDNQNDPTLDELLALDKAVKAAIISRVYPPKE
ncbi:MAG: 1-deoxy-D-xylulose-5-phosphate reductoisomerase [Candidatus Izemoplasmatales bacterium]